MSGERWVVPSHVVYRAFPTETVVLNLETGKYHGLNPTGGRILELLEESKSLGDATARLAAEVARPPEEIRADVERFCGELVARGLVTDGEADR